MMYSLCSSSQPTRLEGVEGYQRLLLFGCPLTSLLSLSSCSNRHRLFSRASHPEGWTRHRSSSGGGQCWSNTVSFVDDSKGRCCAFRQHSVCVYMCVCMCILSGLFSLSNNKNNITSRCEIESLWEAYEHLLLSHSLGQPQQKRKSPPYVPDVCIHTHIHTCLRSTPP